MASIASPIPEIGEIFFRHDPSNKPFKVVKTVRLKGNSGWLMEDDKGRVHALGTCAARVNDNCVLLDVSAEEGTTWGNVFEGLVALGKITKAQLKAHRQQADLRRTQRQKADDRRTIESIAMRNGWKIEVEEQPA